MSKTIKNVKSKHPLIYRAAKDPIKVAKKSYRFADRHAKRVLNRVLAPVYEKKRVNLLTQESNDWVTVRTENRDIKNLDFGELVKYLKAEQRRLVNESKLVKYHQSSDENSKVSIIVLVLNNTSMTLRCLDSIVNAKTTVDHELIVVDNGSNYKTIQALRKYKQTHPKIKLIHIDKNLNFSLGNNVGFTYATGSISVFLNNDTYVSDGWLEALVEPLSSSKVGAVQPVLLYPDNTLQSAGIVFSKKSNLGYGVYTGQSAKSKVAKESRHVQAVTGACLAIRSIDFAKLKGFDTCFVNGQEDVDLCLRLLELKGRESNYVTSKTNVYHDEGKTPGRGKRVAYNREAFVSRWKGKIRPDDEQIYKQDGYSVKEWIIDLDDYKKKNIEMYIPTLKRMR